MKRRIIHMRIAGSTRALCHGIGSNILCLTTCKLSRITCNVCKAYMSADSKLDMGTKLRRAAS